MTTAIVLRHPRPGPVLWTPETFVDMRYLTHAWRLAFGIECPECHAPPEVACVSSRSNADGEPFAFYRPHKARLAVNAAARRAYVAQTAATREAQGPVTVKTARKPRGAAEHQRDRDGRYAGRYGLWEEE